MARPYNDDLADANLRLDRGSAEFLATCAAWLRAEGSPSVVSPPLMEGTLDVWRKAGFAPDRRLMMMERDLRRPPEPPSARVRRGGPQDRDACAAVDDAAFPVDWRVGRLGLEDAAAATGSSQVLVVDGDDGQPAGFAIAGSSYQTAYLQRIAVHPTWQGQGVGTSLVRAAVSWGRRAGARTMLLNTQPDNLRAAGIYRSEGFVGLRQQLHVLRHVEGAS